MPESRIVINGAFRGQRVTGQQRYAIEIADHLLEHPDVREASIPTGGSRAGAWARAQLVGRGRTTGERLLTLTSRGPLLVRDHVVVVHDLFVLTHPEWFSTRYVATHVPILRTQLRSAELIVTVSDPVAAQVRELTGRSDSVVTVPNAPAAIFQPGLPVPGAVERGELTRGGYILAVSSDDPRKNLKRLVQAHRMLPDEVRREAPLVLVGGSSDIFARSSDPRREAADVVRLGYVDDAELAKLYAGAAVVAFPSLDEGFGLPAVEAIASGVETLVSDVPVMRWVCGDAALFADPLSVEAIADALLAAVNARRSAAERAERAERVRERFSWKSSADELHAAISRLTERRTR